MIITVTMNPAIDKTVDIEELKKGCINRLEQVIYDAGGKGINVSKTIKELGGSSIATGFLGSCGGDTISKCMVEYGIASEFVMIDGDTRTNLKILEKDGTITEINEAGPVIDENEIIQLRKTLLRYAGPGSIFIFAGSVPTGVPKDIYKVCSEELIRKGSQIFLDAEGELFAQAIDAIPHIIKPNSHELEAYFKYDHKASQDELIDMGKKLIEMGIQLVIISLGEEGALFLVGNDVYICRSIDVEKHSTVGAGDAMVGAIAYGLDKGLTLEECMTLSVATSTGAVMTQGTKPPTTVMVDEILNKIKAEQVI